MVNLALSVSSVMINHQSTRNRKRFCCTKVTVMVSMFSSVLWLPTTSLTVELVLGRHLVIIRFAFGRGLVKIWLVFGYCLVSGQLL